VVTFLTLGFVEGHLWRMERENNTKVGVKVHQHTFSEGLKALLYIEDEKF